MLPENCQKKKLFSLKHGARAINHTQKTAHITFTGQTNVLAALTKLVHVMSPLTIKSSPFLPMWLLQNLAHVALSVQKLLLTYVNKKS